MKKLIIISLFSSIVLLSTELSQLLKLPFLFEHYMEHQKENHDLSFFHFLGQHYFDYDANVADYEKDMKLPFKSHDVCVGVAFHVGVPPNLSTFEFNLPAKVQDDFVWANEDFHANAFCATIWQPPKFC